MTTGRTSDEHAWSLGEAVDESTGDDEDGTNPDRYSATVAAGDVVSNEGGEDRR
jgi:hypothetical protein